MAKKKKSKKKSTSKKKSGSIKKARTIKPSKASRRKKKASPAKAAAALLPDPENTPFSSVKEILKDIRKGKPIILVDDAHRENEGDLVYASEDITADKVNFMLVKGRGLICITLPPERCDHLGLHQQTLENNTHTGTAFTVKIDARKGVTTGVSAADRARTIRTTANPKCKPEDLVRPGHVDCLRGRKGGVLVRAGHTEGALDLMALAGKKPSAVICEIMNEDGSMMRLSNLELFAAEHKLKIISIQDLIAYRQHHESIVERVSVVDMPTKFGKFKLHSFKSKLSTEYHLALTRGPIEPGKIQKNPVLVRVHSECLTGDSFGSLRCDCGAQLDAALSKVAKAKKGCVLYMRQEGRGIGLLNKMRAYELQEKGADTVEANLALGFKPDLRGYGIGAQILRHLGIRKMKLLTNNPRKIVGLHGFDLEVVERVPLQLGLVKTNKQYLRSKKEKLGHWLTDMD